MPTTTSTTITTSDSKRVECKPGRGRKPPSANCETHPLKRNLCRPHVTRPSRRRHRAVMSPTRTRRPTRPSPSPARPIRTRARPPPRPRTRRPRSVTAAVDREATRTVRSAPRPPAVARAATATARPLPDACRTVPPTVTTRTASKRTLPADKPPFLFCVYRFIMPFDVTILTLHNPS